MRSACFSWDLPVRRRIWNELLCDLTTYGCGLQWCTTFFCFCINFTDTTASLLQLSLKSPSFSRVFHWRTACAAVRNIDTSKDINEARRRSDVAGVCTHAQTAAQRRQSGGGSGASRTYDSHVDGDGDGDDDDDGDDHGGQCA